MTLDTIPMWLIQGIVRQNKLTARYSNRIVRKRKGHKKQLDERTTIVDSLLGNAQYSPCLFSLRSSQKLTDVK